MAVTREAVGAATAGGAVGIIASEALREAGRRELTDDDTPRRVAGVAGIGAVGIAGLGATNVIALPRGASAGLAGLGTTTLAWTAAAERGIVPRLTVDVPEEVNLAGPLVTALALSTAGLAAATLTDVVA